ncbi:MAG: methyltransferase domain-containing protein, partial [Patescibacteria group bacterium]
MYSSDIFYTKFASLYADYATNRVKYLSAVDSFIKNELRIPLEPNSSLIDIGSGDGKRAKKIANTFGIKDITLVDNSDGMIDLIKKIEAVKSIQANIADPDFNLDKKYDIVLCLWNVLGHIPSVDGRKIALNNLAGLVKSNGLIFFDVNNRYNRSQYGLKSVLQNILKDILASKSSNGDFKLKFDTEKELLQTNVHIFNPFEIEHLIKSAGLKIIKRQIINYKTGEK